MKPSKFPKAKNQLPKFKPDYLKTEPTSHVNRTSRMNVTSRVVLDPISWAFDKPFLSPKAEIKKPKIHVKKNPRNTSRNRDLSPQTITLSN